MRGLIPTAHPPLADDHRGERGATTMEFALLLPVIIALLGMGSFTAMAAVKASLLDRAAEIVAREVAIDGDLDRAITEAEATSPFITIDTTAVTDESGATLSGRPPAGAPFVVTLTSTSTSPTAPLTALLVGGDGVGTELTLIRSAKGLGQ